MTDKEAKRQREKEAYSWGPVMCPVCGRGRLEEEFIDACPYCGWGFDRFEYVDWDMCGYNRATVNELRAAYAKEGEGFSAAKYVQDKLQRLKKEE